MHSRKKTHCRGPVPAANVEAMVNAFTGTSAVSSSDVAISFCSTVFNVCSGAFNSYAAENRVTCGAAGVIPAVTTAMLAYSGFGVDANIAGQLCNALEHVVDGNRSNADSVALSDENMAAINLALSRSSPIENAWTFDQACALLQLIAESASPAALARMRESHAARRLQSILGFGPAARAVRAFTPSPYSGSPLAAATGCVCYFPRLVLAATHAARWTQRLIVSTLQSFATCTVSTQMEAGAGVTQTTGSLPHAPSVCDLPLLIQSQHMIVHCSYACTYV